MKTNLFTLLFLFLVCFAFGQNGANTIDQTIAKMKTQVDYSYLEVNNEMFKMLSEIEGMEPKLQEYYKKLSSLQMLQLQRNGEHSPECYTDFLEVTNLKNYSCLMRSEKSSNKLAFYKKEGKSGNEFLLVNSKAVIYIRGTINLKSLGEFEQVMEIAGSAFDM